MPLEDLYHKSESKKLGREAAVQWCRATAAAEKVRLAGYEFDYGMDTLNDLAADGFSVPNSDDFDFSWGFFKQVKGHVTHLVHGSGR